MKLGNILRAAIEGYKKIQRKKIEEVAAPKEVRVVKEVERPVEAEAKEEEVEVEGIEIPKTVPRRVRPVKEEEERRRIFSVYPLIPPRPKKDEPVFAYARIYFDERKRRFVYEIVEPKLNERLRGMLRRIKSFLEEKLDVDLSRLERTEAVEYLAKNIEDAINYFGFKLSEDERKVIKYYVERDFIGYGKIEPLMRDPNIEDISCDGVNVPIFIFHRDPRISSVITNIVFDDAEELDSFVMKLAQLTGKSISVASPLLDGALPDGSRVQATLGTDIARRGSNFTIRKFTKKPLTPTHLILFNTIDEIVLAYLWMAVDYGRSVLVAGGTASGKTTMLNVLSLFIRPEKKIISIEDTAELYLPHTHWVPSVARTPIAKKPGEIDLFELLRESFRQRPDYIIVGEVRGREAYILFQQIATGHPGLATIHAENLQKLSDRLITEPISLPPSLIGSLDIIVFMARMRYKGRFVRKVTEVIEMMKFDPEKGPMVNTVFKWNPINDKFEVKADSYVLKKICEQTGISEGELQEELKRRILILRWLKEREVTDFREIHKVFTLYYTSPNRLLDVVMGEI